MDLSILLAENRPIPSHAIAAMAAVVLGGLQLWLNKGTRTHKIIGYVWVSLMIYVSVSALFIHEIRVWGNFSPIHILPAVALVSIYLSIRAARAGAIKTHKWFMISLYFFALIVTGLFTLLPGRTMNTVLFGG